MNLREWTILYVQHKDVLKRQLVSVKEQPDKIIFTFKDHTLHAYAMELLSLPIVPSQRSDGKTLITTLQTRDNVSLLVKHWEAFSKHAGLTIIFVNPEKNEKWFIVPYTHSQIADPNIETGIAAMAENVPYVD